MQLDNDLKKQKIANNILENINDKTNHSENSDLILKNIINTDFFAIYNSDIPIGFVSVKQNNEFTAEIYAVALLRDYQRIGLGKKLILNIETVLKSKGFKFLMVKPSYKNGLDSCVNFFKKLSFYTLDDTEKLISNNLNAMSMIKSI
jgi:ribosomal protein S18 acetylase RimI-like enzyme